MPAPDNSRRMVRPGMTFRVFVSSTFQGRAVKRHTLKKLERPS